MKYNTISSEHPAQVFFVNFSKIIVNGYQYSFPVIPKNGSFRDFVEELSTYAKTHTVFVYLDPIKPSQLSFNDLKRVYDHLWKSGQSIECLINFLSLGFLRAVEGLKESIVFDGKVDVSHNSTLKWDAIAGGAYWHSILTEELFSDQKVDLLADGYSGQLERWFRYVLKYPIREKYEDALPKYHLIFGSRHPDAVDLINRAMVKARREFVGSRFVKGMLFDNRPKEELVDEDEIKGYLLSILRKSKNMTWKQLRVAATLAHPCMYTDSDFNGGIKKLIQSQTIKSNCPGTKKEDGAEIWL